MLPMCHPTLCSSAREYSLKWEGVGGGREVGAGCSGGMGEGGEQSFNPHQRAMRKAPADTQGATHGDTDEGCGGRLKDRT